MADDDHSVVLFDWREFYQGLDISPSDFYAAIEAAIVARGLPHMSIGRIWYREAGLPSWREYLHVSRQDLSFDICGARCGGGTFYVSYWFIRHESFFRGWLRLLRLPFILPILLMRLWAMLAVTAAEFILGNVPPPAMGFLDLRFLREVCDHFFPKRHYATDTGIIFAAVVQGAISEVLGGLTSAQGLRALSSEEHRALLGNSGPKTSAMRGGRF